jgi:RNA polymerase sigma factor (sigma-70 family)
MRGPATTVDLPRLVTAAGSGDATAWDALVERFTDLLWSVARAHRLSHADAADVVQSTWLRLVENLDRIEDPERLPGWLATTARRECLQALRRAGRERPVAPEESFATLEDAAAPVDAALLESERDAELWRVFDGLPDRCRRLLRVLGASPAPAYVDVAAALDMPVGSIGPTRARCLARLRTLSGEASVPANGSDPGGVR